MKDSKPTAKRRVGEVLAESRIFSWSVIASLLLLLLSIVMEHT